ncbi:MAG: DEAD/DEAH box helicase [Deltaproteobacteria bacterium]|nr:DEAD/DEAH box helicase [Deltaproteobacteria bacterium]
MQPGQIAFIRSRRYVVENVTLGPEVGDSPLVRLSCIEDDALGESLEVLWNHERDARIETDGGWKKIAQRGFDDPAKFSAFLHTLRWNSVTATDPALFQAPYRAGIDVKAYQLEPLRKALRMPRVSLFIADDVGLGKTIEAGLIVRELILRQKVRRVVVACPPSVVTQWQEEMDQRFGLHFVVLDRDFVVQKRRELGYATNPWTTHRRFIISHSLLRDESYTGPLREWLKGEEGDGGALLILDEAHNVAPASGSKYAIDSKLTKVVRDLAPLFEHKLFLSATPHNGHSNSFSALLEILDPLRFCRGVPVKGEGKLLEEVMVRRLKKDLREIESDFPKRNVPALVIDGLPEGAAELVLSRLLHAYRDAREKRLSSLSKSERASAMLVVTSLQKRLLSSIEAFARTLRVHRDAIERQSVAARSESTAQATLLLEAPGADDDRADLSDDENQAEDDAVVTAASAGHGAPGADERALLEEMTEISKQTRHEDDARFKRFAAWLKANLCPGLGTPGAAWADRRVLVFTEYADTKRWITDRLRALLGDEDADLRVRAFQGGKSEKQREEIKAAFNAEPDKNALRILVTTDAFREGVNLQNHCADLFHFDVPWNPGRMEQRNGRIDRKLQRAKEVNCYYFVLPQRAEDRVLEVLVAKTKLIHEQLGSLPPVVDRTLARLLGGGISHGEVDVLRATIDRVDADHATAGKVVDEELEVLRLRQEKLARQVSDCDKLLAKSRDWLGFDESRFRDALSASLEMLEVPGLAPAQRQERAGQEAVGERFVLPELAKRVGNDPSWTGTLDSLRVPRRQDQTITEWRRDTPLRPVVFREPGSLDGAVVHLHLEHKLVQRLLGRFLAQGFVHDELSRACVLLTDDPIPRVVALGRLSLYGAGAARLHDEILAVAAEWTDPALRKKAAKPLAARERDEALALVELSLASRQLREVSDAVKKQLLANAAQEVKDLVPHLEAAAERLLGSATKKLVARGNAEALAMGELLTRQRERIAKHQHEVENDSQLTFEFTGEAKRQLEAEKRHWTKRLAELDQEITTAPAAIRASYELKTHRLEPAGLVYLWPRSR